MSKRSVGNYGEQIAVNYLKTKGFKIVDKNWYCRQGELDVVAQRKGYTVFVEVKFRSYKSRYPAITKYKLSKLRRTIYKYQAENKLKCSWALLALYIYPNKNEFYIKQSLITYERA